MRPLDGRRVTNHDIAMLRDLAARGFFLSQAAHMVGLPRGRVVYWNARADIGLVTRGNTYRFVQSHPAPDIIAYWHLHQTMQRIHAWLDQGDTDARNGQSEHLDRSVTRSVQPCAVDPG